MSKSRFIGSIAAALVAGVIVGNLGIALAQAPAVVVAPTVATVATANHMWTPVSLTSTGAVSVPNPSAHHAKRATHSNRSNTWSGRTSGSNTTKGGNRCYTSGGSCQHRSGSTGSGTSGSNGGSCWGR